MGSTSQGERGVVSGTATVAAESKQRGDGGAVPAAIKPSCTASKRGFDRRNPRRTLLRGAVVANLGYALKRSGLEKTAMAIASA